MNGVQKLVTSLQWHKESWWTFRTFLFFSAQGRGTGSPGRQGGDREGGGCQFLIENLRSEAGGGGEGAGRVSAGNLGEGGLGG